MAFTFPAMVAWDPNGKQNVKNVSFQVYAVTDTAFTTPLVITDPFGAGLPGNILNSGTMGVFPQFQAPNSTVTIADATKTYAWTVPCLVQDAATAAFINTSGTATKAALDGAYAPASGSVNYAPKATTIPAWVTATAYTAGQQVISPAGDIVSAIASHTSGATFTPANWAYVRVADYFINVKSYGAKGDNTANDTSALQAAITAAAGKTVFVPAGTYLITSGLTMGATTSMVLGPNATIKASATISGPMLTIGTTSTWWQNQMLAGGMWDCNNYAQSAVSLIAGLNSTMKEFTWNNPTMHGLILGDTSATNTTHELHLESLKAYKTQSVAVVSGSYGIWTRNTFDSMIKDCVIVGPERSFRNDCNGNVFFGCHAYGLGNNQYPVAVFSENGSDNKYIGCYADTPSLYGWEITAASYRWSISDGIIYNNNFGLDNVVIGIHTALAEPNSGMITNTKFVSATGSNRIAKDYDGNFPSNNLLSLGNTPGSRGNANYNVVTTVLSDRVSDLSYGRLLNAGPAPTLQTAAGMGTTPPTPVLDSMSTDQRGRFTFGTGTSPSAGILGYVTFNRPYAVPPVVTIIARNGSTSPLRLYVRDVGTTSFSYACDVAPSASAANTVYAADYAVMA